MIVDLNDAIANDRTVVGSKAANLAAAAVNGFPVPPGFVVPVGVDVDEPEVRTAVNLLGGPVAVRSSALAEDLAEASYAGLYESFLNVSSEDVPNAIRRCRDSGGSTRVSAYQTPRAETGVAVLVQRMVPAAAAGVAFTANPVTGARDEIIVTAVSGLGEPLVAGEAVGEEWLIRDGRSRLPRPADVLDPQQALAIADLARRAADLFGQPQDIEWAIVEGSLSLLQARPMTALPEPVTWTPPGRGLWVSNFRIGEWLPDPVTPLFGDWLLPLLDEGFRQGMQETAGASVPFAYGLVNGWYYARPNPSPSHLPAAILRSRGRLLRFMINALVRPGRDPEGAAVALLDRLYRRWRDELLPAYRALAASSSTDLSTTELNGLVEEIARIAGRHLWYLAVVGGAAWKMENCLHHFLDGHRLEQVEAQLLLRGLDARAVAGPGYAVYSLDWFHPTAGEKPPALRPQRADRLDELRAERRQVETTCQSALAARPRPLRQWNAMLRTAQRYALIREEQARELTLGWPLLRACAHLLGETLTEAGVIDEPEELHFLTRQEITQDLPLGSTARERRAQWKSERRLIPPLALGSGPPLLGRHLERTLGITRADQE
ncbi:MAG: PEP/pyruvate-binding domain-containing protein, partial [Haloechinothrix sp.]